MANTTIVKNTAPKKVRIAAFNYYPVIFKDTDNQVKGIWVDLFDEIAHDEYWDIEYIFGTWQEGIERIKKGEVDILTSAAYDPERAEYLSFCDDYLLTVWGTVYTAENSEINNLFNLQDKSIGVMYRDFNGSSLRKMLDTFRVQSTLIYYESFESIFQAIRNGEIDAGVVNNMYGTPKQREYNLRATSILLNPFDVYFAVKKGKDVDILATLNAYVNHWKNEDHTELKDAIDKWSYSTVNIFHEIPEWVIPVASLLVIAIVVVLVFLLILKKKINEATSKLSISEERFSLAMNAANDGLFDWNITENTIYYSPRWKSMLGYEENEIPNDFSEWERLTKKEDVEESWKRLKAHIDGESDRFEMEFKMRHKDGYWVEVLARANAVFDKSGKAVRVVGTHKDITSRKRVELELKESVTNLNLAQEIARIGNWSFDPENKEFKWSEQFYNIFEFDRNKSPLTLEDFANSASKEEFLKVKRLFNEAIDKGKDFYTQVKIDSADSGVKWIRIICRAEMKMENNGYFLRGTIQDITSEKSAELALLESEENYKSLYNNIPLGVFKSTLDGKLISSNDNMYRLYGYEDKDEFLKRDAYEFYAERNERDQMLTNLKRDGFVKNYISRERKKDGTQIFIKCNYILTIDERTGTKYIEGVLEDITSQKQNEDALIESERKYRQLYNNTPVMLYSLDVEGDLVSVSDYWLETLGYEREEVLRNKVINFLSPKSKAEAEEVYLPQFMQTGFLKDVEQEMIKKNGELISVQLSAISEYDETGAYAGTLAVLVDISEEKKAQDALRESEELFRHSFDFAANGICLISTSGEFIKVNRVFEKLTGYKEAEILSRSFNEITHPEDKSISSVPMQKLLNGDYNKTAYEKRYIRKDGTTIWLFISISLLRDKGGNPQYFVSHFVDISERKNAETTLRKNLEALNQAESLANLGYFELNILSGESYWSKGFYALLGLERTGVRLNYREVMESIHPEDLTKVETQLSNAIKEKSTFNTEFRVIQKTGVVINIHGIAVTFYDSKGKPEIIQGTFQNITERELAKQELINKQKLLDSIQDNIPVMITRYDPNNNLLHINKEMERLTGYTSEDAAKVDFLERAYPDPQMRKTAVDYMAKAVCDWKEFPFRAKNGDIIYSEWSNIKLNDGLRIGIGIDIRQRKNAEKAIVESQRLSAMGEMASAVAHDFNNALQSIYGNVELALFNPELPDSIRKYLKTIRSASNDASTRVKLLQRFGGKTGIKKEYASLNINDVIKDVLVQSRPLWKDRAEMDGITIKIETDYGNVKDIKGNESELRSVLYNLVKNSIEALPKGGTISISSKMVNDKVEILVVDTGIGMNEKTKSRIFDPFFSTKGFEVGRGLGMSGVYSIIKEHDGDVSVKYSAPGKGTIISIMIPATGSKKMIPIEKAKDEFISGARILWVDDEKMIREVALEMLETIGHQGVIASSGEQALEMLKNNEYDLVVTDLGMPGMNGWELITRINQEYGTKYKIAILTGWGAEIPQEKIKEYNVDDILSKPFRMSQLQKFISDILSKPKYVF